MKGDDLAERFTGLAVRVLAVVDALPRTVASRHIANQLARSGTSAGANYEEARGAESRADFAHKFGVAWKETRETLSWLNVLQRPEVIKPKRLEPLIQEATELSSILARSVSTTKKGRKNKSQHPGAEDEP